MPLYKRKFPCAVCGKPVYWDSDRQLLSCGCGTTKATFVNLEAFEQLPKYARHVSEKAEFSIDSISFFDDEDNKMHISDQSKNEDPKMIVSFINYPRERRVQVRIAFAGKRHKEKLKYNVKDPKDWKEWGWITIPIEIADKLADFLKQKNPLKLANWM